MAKQNECRDEFSSMQPLKVPVHKFSYFMICIVWEFVKHSFFFFRCKCSSSVAFCASNADTHISYAKDFPGDVLNVVSILCNFFLCMYPLWFLLLDSNRKCRGLMQRKKLEPVTWNFLSICKLFLCVTGLSGNFYLNLWQCYLYCY
jgi:hypothetical protein